MDELEEEVVSENEDNKSDKTSSASDNEEILSDDEELDEEIKIDESEPDETGEKINVFDNPKSSYTKYDHEVEDLGENDFYKFNNELKRMVAENVTEEDYLKLKELVPVTYSWISDEEKHKHYGLIAQQVEKVFPELTRKKVFGQYMTINYIGLIPILVGMIQTQNERIKNLENKLNGSKIRMKWVKVQ